MNSSNHFPNDSDINMNLYFSVALSLQAGTAAFGILVNSLLFYGLAKASNWPFGQRLLFLNVTASAALSTIIRTCQSSFQIYQYKKTGWGSLDGSGLEWCDTVADCAQAAVAVGMAALAFQNLLALHHCSRKLCSRKLDNDKKKQIFCIIAMIAGIWIGAFGLVSLGINPQAQVDNKTYMSNIFSYFGFALGVLMELSVAGAIWLTLRKLRQLGVDFEIRRAQQPLAARVQIKGTMTVTMVISRVLIVHVTTWLVSLAFGFGLDRFLRSNVIEYETWTESGNGNAVYMSIVDTVALSFHVVYPFVVFLKQPRLGQIRLCYRNGPRTGGVGGTVIPNIRVVDVAHAAKLHHDAIEDHWNKVVRANASKPPSPNGKTALSTLTINQRNRSTKEVDPIGQT